VYDWGGRRGCVRDVFSTLSEKQASQMQQKVRDLVLFNEESNNVAALNVLPPSSIECV
jgi:hypothetical protein